MSFVEFIKVSKIHKTGDEEFKAVDDISSSIEGGEFVVIISSSGTGKTTILNMLSGMDSPSLCYIFTKSENISKLNQRRLTNYRRNKIGFILHFYNLCQNLAVKENVKLATQICKDPIDAEKAKNRIGFRKRMNNFLSQISGSEQHCVAIAHALAKNPEILLCDKSIGALDYSTDLTVVELLQGISRISKKIVVLTTHNSLFYRITYRVIELKYGKVYKNYKNENSIPTDQLE